VSITGQTLRDLLRRFIGGGAFRRGGYNIPMRVKRGSRRANRHTTFIDPPRKAERRRHLRQVRLGQLDGWCGRLGRKQFVTTEARYAAHGLVPGTARELR